MIAQQKKLIRPHNWGSSGRVFESRRPDHFKPSAYDDAGIIRQRLQEPLKQIQPDP